MSMMLMKTVATMVIMVIMMIHYQKRKNLGSKDTFPSTGSNSVHTKVPREDLIYLLRISTALFAA